MNPNSISFSVASRIHDAFALAERRRLTTIIDLPVESFASKGHELLPATTAPLDFTCAVCFEKVNKGDKQQLLNCGHKFVYSVLLSGYKQINTRRAQPVARPLVVNSI